MPDGLVEDDEHALARRLESDQALGQLVQSTQKYVEASFSSATARRYNSAWNQFATWCAEHNIGALPAPPAAVVLYITHLADQGYAWNSINVVLAAIDHKHKHAGARTFRKMVELETVTRGIRRTIGTAVEQASPITVDILRKLVATCPDTPIGVRDRAILLLGFAGAFRRSELVNLDFKAVVEEENGFVVTLFQSKTDQEGAGMLKGIPYGGTQATCPVRALKAWMRVHPSRSGEERPNGDLPLFVQLAGARPGERLGDEGVNAVVKRAASAAGLEVDKYSGHSLRAGFVTSAARAGKRLDVIMQQTGHTSVETTMRYIRRALVLHDNPAEGIGL